MRVTEGPDGKKIFTGEKQERSLSGFVADLEEAERGVHYAKEHIMESVEKGEAPSRTDLNQLLRHAEQMPRIAKKIREKAGVADDAEERPE